MEPNGWVCPYLTPKLFFFFLLLECIHWIVLCWVVLTQLWVKYGQTQTLG